MLTLEQLERAYVAQGVYKAVAEQVKTKTPGNMRAALDAHFAEAMDAMRAAGVRVPQKQTWDCEIAGEKVGTYTVSTTPGSQNAVPPSLRIADEDAYMDWAIGNGFAHMEVDGARVLAHFEATGDIPDGCEVTEPAVEAVPEKVKTTFRIDPEKVARAVELPPALAGLLEGGVA